MAQEKKIEASEIIDFLKKFKMIKCDYCSWTTIIGTSDKISILCTNCLDNKSKKRKLYKDSDDGSHDVCIYCEREMQIKIIKGKCKVYCPNCETDCDTDDSIKKSCKTTVNNWNPDWGSPCG